LSRGQIYGLKRMLFSDLEGKMVGNGLKEKIKVKNES
jgi:hypothetical protein